MYEPKGKITVKKVDENNAPLDGARFSLQRRSDRKEMERSIEPRRITKFTNLDPGDYILMEITMMTCYQEKLGKTAPKRPVRLDRTTILSNLFLKMRGW